MCGLPLTDHVFVKNGRPPGALLVPRQPLDAPTVAEAVAVISCWYALLSFHVYACFAYVLCMIIKFENNTNC